MGSRARELIGPLAACAVALVLARRGHARAAIVTACGATTLLALSIVAPRASARLEHSMAVFAGWVGAALSFVLLTLSFVCFIVPAGLGLRLLGRRPLSVGSDPRNVSYWEPVLRSDALYARTYLLEARRAHGATPGLVVLAGMGAMAILLGLNAVLGQYLRRTAELRAVEREVAVERTKAAWRPGLRWLERYWRDAHTASRRRYVPFVGWRHQDYQGETLRIVDGYRHTVPAGAPTDPEITMFGGSALWGVGARDAHTIPSEVARLLIESGRPARVVNCAEHGYTLWQDVMLFAQRLSLGDRPRVAAFYDGINELMVQVTEGPSEEPSHFNAEELASQLHHRKLDLWGTLRGNNGIAIFLSELRNPIEVPSDYPMPRPIDEYVAPAARHYRAAMALAIALGAQFDVPVLFFWQPALCSRDPPHPEEAVVRASITNLRAQCAAYAALSAALDQPPLHRLDGIFDGRDEAYYFDYVHVNEAANRLVAEHMLAPLVTAYDVGVRP